MSKLRAALALLVVTGIVGVAASVHATSIAHVNYVTFSAPVALPGVSLPAGTYIFESPLAPSSIDVVRVSSRDRRQVFLTAFTQTVIRPARGTWAPQIMLGEIGRGTPPPVKVWYPAGEPIGHAFIY